MRKLLGVLLLAYIISPIDAIPDAIPFIGTIDDGAAGAIALKLLTDKPAQKRTNRR